MIARALTFVAMVFPTTVWAAPQAAIMHVGNMVCGADPHIIRDALMKVAGVQSVEISLESHTVIVTFDSQLASFSELQQATGAAGYPAN